MKVRITHSVNLDDVPSQVGGLLEAALDEMCEVAETMRATTCMIKKSLALKECVKILDDCRQDLAAIDNSFAESSSLLEGYIKTNEPEKEPVGKKLSDIPRGQAAIRQKPQPEPSEQTEESTDV